MTDPTTLLWMAFVAFATTILGILTKIAHSLANAFIAKIRKESLQTDLAIAKSEIQDVVDCLNQTVVSAMKMAASDGKLTEDEIVEIRARCAKMIESRFQPDFWNEMFTKLGILDVDAQRRWISSQIESAVYREKAS